MDWESLSSEFVNNDWVYHQICLSKENFNVADCIEDLTPHKWKIFSCTCIFNYTISSTKEKLKTDLKHAMKTRNIVFTDCEFKWVPLLGCTEEDNEALKITIKQEQKIFEALFISRGSKCKKTNKFLNLPVLLLRSTLKVLIKPMLEIFEKLFQCSISPIRFSVNELLAITLITVKNGGFDDEADINLEYTLKELNNSSISYGINLKNFGDLWDSICETIETLSTKEVLNIFYHELAVHCRRLYGIQLSYFTLHSVKIENNILTEEGKVANKVPEVYDFMLKYLTQRINFEKRISV